jgi:hypothetical protein
MAELLQEDKLNESKEKQTLMESRPQEENLRETSSTKNRATIKDEW